MVEANNNDKDNRIEEYRIIFEELPTLRDLALSYWRRTKKLSPDPFLAILEEEEIFYETVFAISNELLDTPSFLEAIENLGTDLSEHVIIESICMIDIVLDVDLNKGDENRQ